MVQGWLLLRYGSRDDEECQKSRKVKLDLGQLDTWTKYFRRSVVL